MTTTTTKPVRPLTLKQMVKAIADGWRSSQFLAYAARHGWYTDGRMMLKITDGERGAFAAALPTMNADDEANAGRFFGNADQLMIDATRKPWQPLGTPTPIDSDDKTPLCQMIDATDKRVRLNARYVATVRKRFPSATFRAVDANRHGPGPVLAFNGETLVAMIMPLS